MTLPFHPIARLLARTMHPTPWIDLSAVEAYLPSLSGKGEGQGALITVNHYSAPDFKAWWFVILISAFVPAEIHWVVTSGWTNAGWLTGFTHWLFPHNARLFGFTPMPAMPPNPAEAELRAAAVRETLRYAREASQPVIGMAPEGGDSPGGVLATLHPGVGRFIQLLSQHCPLILPVGVWGENGRIMVKFGNPYQLDVPEGLSADVRDRLVGETVMQHIALLLPDRLRGAYV
jgi:hypothetical protein